MATEAATSKDEALRYANRHWPVFPLHDTTSGGCSCGDPDCGSPGKHPRYEQGTLEDGVKSATTDRRQIEAWWQHWPEANIGLAAGEASGITVIDLDSPQAKEELEAAGVSLPKSYTVKTPRGWHVYINYREQLKQTAAILPKVDIRNDGGYVVAPPSVVHDSQYRVVYDKQIVDWDGLDGVQRTKRSTEYGIGPQGDNQPGWISDLLNNGAPEGSRNDKAAQLAGYFRQLKTPRDITYTILLRFAEKCHPPMSTGELNAVITSVWRYQPTESINKQEDQPMPPPLADFANIRHHIYRWPDMGLTVDVDRITAQNQKIEAWLRVSTDQHGLIYGPMRFDLLSPSQRDPLVRQLNKRSEAYPWASALQHVSHNVVEAQNESGTLIDAATYKRQEGFQWLAKPVVRSRSPSVIYADGGTGKSTFAAAVCVSLASGQTIIPGIEPTRRVKCLYLDWETDEDDWQAGIDAICDGNGIDLEDCHILYRHVTGPIASHADQILRDVIENDIEFVVVDSLGGASGGEMFGEAEPRSYFALMRQARVASLGITHTNKAEGIYGSVYYRNYARVALELDKEEEEETDSMTLALKDKKRNRGGLKKPMGLRVEFESDEDDMPLGIRFVSADLTETVDLSKKLTRDAKITALLGRNGPMELKDIAEALGESKTDAIKTTLNRGRKQERYMKRVSGNGEWMLVETRYEPVIEGDPNDARNTVTDVTKHVTEGVTPQHNTPLGGVADVTPDSEGDKESRNMLRPEEREDIPW